MRRLWLAVTVLLTGPAAHSETDTDINPCSAATAAMVWPADGATSVPVDAALGAASLRPIGGCGSAAGEIAVFAQDDLGTPVFEGSLPDFTSGAGWTEPLPLQPDTTYVVRGRLEWTFTTGSRPAPAPAGVGVWTGRASTTGLGETRVVLTSEGPVGPSWDVLEVLDVRGRTIGAASERYLANDGGIAPSFSAFAGRGVLRDGEDGTVCVELRVRSGSGEIGESTDVCVPETTTTSGGCSALHLTLGSIPFTGGLSLILGGLLVLRRRRP